MKKRITLLMAFFSIAIYSYAQEEGNNAASVNTDLKSGNVCKDCCRKDGNIPLGVMNAHIHAKHEWMVSYTYMDMYMKGNKMGTTNASDDVIYKNYTMAPETMNMQMHMLMVMYGVTDRLTLMAMGGYGADKMAMNMSSAMMSMPGMTMTMGNMTMTSTSSGIADTKLYGLYNFIDSKKSSFIGSLGLSLPTGSIKETGTTMLGENQRLPYSMQMGTGSVGLLPDITYLHKVGLFSYGANAGAMLNMNDNSLGYHFGNQYHATAWGSYQFLPFVSGSLRVEGIMQDKISGSDAEMDNFVYQQNDPTTRAENYGGKWLNTYVGLNFHTTCGGLNHFTLLVEAGMPVYQNLNGVQMALHNNLLAELYYSF